MPKLNLETKTREQELIKAYLEENASDVLADKINHGVQIDKDGKALVNKKTLDGFMKYATEEARKLASKGASSACVEDAVVYGWAVHYFEEDTIVGKLYNEDGTEYKPPMPEKKPVFTKSKETNTYACSHAAETAAVIPLRYAYTTDACTCCDRRRTRRRRTARSQYGRRKRKDLAGRKHLCRHGRRDPQPRRTRYGRRKYGRTRHRYVRLRRRSALQAL